MIATRQCRLCLLAMVSCMGFASGSEPQHWAFLPPAPPALPYPADSGDPSINTLHPIDALVDARLATQGATFLPAADRRTLLRRLSIDLTGLPATTDEVAAFENDRQPGAVERVVDRLLDSPHFGERWARHWLDISRYADTKGYVFEEDREYAEAYKYRDWIVARFNDDLPYDEFIKLQLAADQLGKQGDLPAMGFLTLGRRFLNNPHDIIDDRIDVVTRGLLGLTVSCARCHDHKYDPIPTADYYSLYGVFASSHEPGGKPSSLRLVDKENPSDAAIFLRGNPHRRGSTTPRRFLTALAGPDTQPFVQGSGRVELAEAIASSDNPLTARVWVNRIWRHLFGVGLVETPSDFGVRSTPPVQQDLLDWLAVELMNRNWSTKSLIRDIVLSQTYRQACRDLSGRSDVNSGDLQFHGRRRRRLDLETLRDSILHVSGELDLRVGGPSVELLKSPYPRRRTLYGKIERQNLPSLYRTFDFASPDAHAPKRYETMVPLQALFLMNSPWMIEQAAALAERSDKPGADEQQRIDELYQLTFARSPSPGERSAAAAFLAAADEPAADEKSVPPWTQLAHALLMTNEFYFYE